MSSLVFGLAVAASMLPMNAQTLAHRGWAGSGITVDPWWKGALFYEVNPDALQTVDGDAVPGLTRITAQLDYLQSLGVDAIVLSPLAIRNDAGGKPLFHPRFGSDENFDQLQQEASRRKMRLIIDFQPQADESIGSTVIRARFWLTRGAGGLLLTSSQENSDPGTMRQADRAQLLRQLRQLCEGFAGQRILISDTSPDEVLTSAATSTLISHRNRASKARQTASWNNSGAHLVVDRRLNQLKFWNASALQAIIFEKAPAPDALLESDTSNAEPGRTRLSGALTPADQVSVAKMIAAMLFLGRETPLLASGQELGALSREAHEDEVAQKQSDPASLLNWYRSLSQLRHQRGVLRSGSLQAVATGYPDVVAWARQGPGNEAPVLIVCNASPQTRIVSVAGGLRRLQLSTANGVHVLALSSSAMSPSYSVAGITLPPYGVYVAELRQPGLEDAPAPAVSHHRGR